MFANLRIAAGIETGEYTRTDWHDAWLYKRIEAAACAYCVTGDEWLLERMEKRSSLFRRPRPTKGTSGARSRHAGPSDFSLRDSEVFTIGRLLTAAVVHRRTTGSDSFYEIALRVADFLWSVLGKSVKLGFACYPSAIMGLVELYRESGVERYLECAGLIVASQGSEPGGRGCDLRRRANGILGTDQTQDRTRLRDTPVVVGHNVLFSYLFSGAADVQSESPVPTVDQPLERMRSDLVSHKMAIKEDVSPMGHDLSVNCHIVVEATGKPYELPTEGSCNETCGQVGKLMWNYWMLCASPDGRCVDMTEHELHNGITSGVDLGGENYWYRNQLRRGTHHVLAGHKAMREREKPRRRRICCPINVARTIAEWPGYLFGTDADGIWLHHYAGCSAELSFGGGSLIVLDVKTEYPWDGAIAVTLAEAAPGYLAITRV